ncbi:hypothetical protein [Microcoleus sp. D2_18a_D3]|uniref:hypothetical protein n=1 Tax=Microcoleus sp. D2_18a_D3 TaxID=3055330 RepID=UPI002FD14C41
MKKLKKQIHTFLPTAKIFLDDVEKIEEILKESCFSTYNITPNEPKLDSICEIQRTRELFEESYSSYIIKLEDEYELESINEIIEIAEKQDFYNLEIVLTKPYFNLELDQFNTQIYCDDDSLCIGMIERIKPIILKRKTYFQHWLFGINKKFVVFTKERSNQKTNFFIKNKDQIILSSISAIIGALFATLFRFILIGQATL